MLDEIKFNEKKKNNEKSEQFSPKIEMSETEQRKS